jgi:hypothetical protein
MDRLSTAYIGALGNTWIRTPAFDQLAVESLAFDRAMIDSPVIAETYHGYWSGEPAWRSASPESRGEASDLTLAQFCGDCSLPTLLITDDDEIATHPLSAAFEEVIQLAPLVELKQATDWEETQLARFFAGAVELLANRRSLGLVWLHTSALGRIWDSPQTFRDQYAAEDDPPAAAFIEPPSQLLAAGIDPDVLLGMRHAYAGEIAVLDSCLGTFLDSIQGSDWSRALLIATACRGYPLGEHGIVGRAADDLYAELLHVPWFVRVPGGPKYGERRPDLVQPVDLFETLFEWLAYTGQSASSAPAPWYGGLSLLRANSDTRPMRRLAVARSTSGETALATPAWFLRAPASLTPGAGGRRRLELYVKPDDRFEANEISDRCLEIVEEFRDVVQALDTAILAGAVPEIALSDALVEDVDSRSTT